jgi:hypothetical protein
MWLWPKVRLMYYFLSAAYFLLNGIGIVAIIRRRA